MKKIVMLGCENSHVKTFLKIMQESPEKYRDIDVIGLYTEHSKHYSVSVSFVDRTAASDATIGNDCFVREFDEFCELLAGGEQKISYDDFIAPVFVLNAINRSLATGNEETIRKYEV